MVLLVSAISIAAGVSIIITMLRIFVAKQLRIICWPPSLVCLVKLTDDGPRACCTSVLGPAARVLHPSQCTAVPAGLIATLLNTARQNRFGLQTCSAYI